MCRYSNAYQVHSDNTFNGDLHMSRINWDETATEQFDSLNDEIREEWAELRKLTLRHK